MMNFSFSNSRKWLYGLALLGACVTTDVNAALVSLAQQPLQSATTSTVLPNIIFTIDDSGSMAGDFMPDWVDDIYSRSSSPSKFKNSAINGIFYNPAIVYTPPVMFNADGSLDTSTYPSIGSSSWSSVLYDAYKKENSGSGSRLCPDGTAPSGSSPNQTCNLTNGADYYAFVPGEYCSDPALKTCRAQTSPDAVYKYPALMRWCNSTALTTCQATRVSPYTNARYPGMPAVTTISISGSGSTSVSSVKVNGEEIMSASVSASTSSSTLATNIASRINNCTSAITGNCTVAGYSASASSGVVTIWAPTNGITYTPVVTKSGTKTFTVAAFNGGVPGSEVRVQIKSTITSYPYPGSTSKYPDRTDCAGTTCSYTEEMTNFANWFTYYHTRMEMMKTATGRSFKSIDNKFRVGFNAISYTGATDGSKFLHVDKFELAQKNSWYKTLYGSVPSSYTPLRGALSKVGRIFAHKLTGAADPMQYSCQQNFSILSTDGYWNTHNESSSYGPIGLGGANVGDLDSGSTTRPMLDINSTANTLADVAKYYHDTDLRNSSLSNCTGALGLDVCEDNVFTTSSDNNTKQHMTSFGIALGADGTLNYQDDYLTATSGDYYDLKNGLNGKNWPIPSVSDGGGDETNIDDLWHAAVNGQGQYFSAKNPKQVVDGLNAALASISKKIGSGAAAATSNLNVTLGNNSSYVPSYTTGSWRGNLCKYPIDVDDGHVQATAAWCVEDLPKDECKAPAVLRNEVVSGDSIWYCVTGGVTTCPDGILDGTDCKVEVSLDTTGTMKAMVGPNTDTRKIYIKKADGSSLVDFKYDNLSASQKALFDSPTALSQWPALTLTQQGLAQGANLVDYLRGQTQYEDRTENANRLFRKRDATLGDFVESQPIYFGAPTFSYLDAGYSTFKASNASRAGTVFIGGNDGMLHAFDSSNGKERWAFVPSMVMKNMWKLADFNYATNHTYYVNGAAVSGDIYVGGSWKSILVGSLHGGGRGYYALDITDPTSPIFLWELSFTQTTDHVLVTDDNIGYSFAEPKIMKDKDGNWHVYVTSGYNNVSPGDGGGYIYELNPMTGAVVHKIETGTGDTTTPSGLAKIELYAGASEVDNTGTHIYGGDLLGNVWRVDMSDYSIKKFALLKDSLGGTQPVTTRPELATIDDKRVVYVGTGKYLEVSDLTTIQQNTVYAIKDSYVAADLPLVNPRTILHQQTFSTSGGQRTASVSDGIFVDPGWYEDLPVSGERVAIDPQLEFAVLAYSTIIPEATVCAPGGTGYTMYVDFRTGTAMKGSPGGAVGQKTNSPNVGMNIYTTASGKIVLTHTESGSPIPDVVPDVKFESSTSNYQGKRVIWREITQ